MNVYRGSLIIQFLITVLLVMVLITPPAVGGVHAQDQTLLMLEPTGTNVGVDGLVTLSVQILGGQDLIAYDLTITYDAEVVALDSWAQGSYFTKLAVIRNDNQPGSLRLAVTQVGAPAVSGDGTILTLVFRGKTPGSTQVKLERAELVSVSGQQASVTTSDGEIVVTAVVTPTLEPTATATVTATITRTIAPTLTRTLRVPTATRTATIPLVVSQTQAEGAAKTPVAETGVVRNATATVGITSPTPKAGVVIQTATRSDPALTGESSAGELTATRPDYGQTQVITTETAVGGRDRADQTVLNTILWGTALFLLVLLLGLGTYYLKNQK